MTKKLFVGNLPDGCTNVDLRQLFGTIGQVTECDVLKNYGFVHMATQEQAQQAVYSLSGQDLYGNAIKVQLSTPRNQPSSGGHVGTKLFVGSLPEGCTSGDLQQLFGSVGKVTECDVVFNYGFVHMSKTEEAQEAVRLLSGHILNGTAIRVQHATSERKTESNSEGPVGKKLFVGSLPDGCTSGDLQQLFGTVGKVTECDVIDNYGFVHMSKTEEAQEAVRTLSGHSLYGTTIRVQHATSGRRTESISEGHVGKKLFVGNLPDGCSNDDLEQLFGSVGKVTECDVMNNYGFVHMSKTEEAQEAVRRLSGHLLYGNAIKVQQSTSGKRTEPSSGGHVGKKLFVGNLPDGCSNGDLQQLFGTVGKVTECDVISSYGFVHMSNTEEAKEAVRTLSGHTLYGCAIRVQHATSDGHTHSSGGRKVTKKLFVGNLPEGTSSGELRRLFEYFGEVTECDVKSNYGFVHMRHENESQEAVTHLDETDFYGSRIRVQFSTSSVHKSTGGKDGVECYNCGKMGHMSRDCYMNGSGGNMAKKLFVGNLPDGCTNGDLRQLFETVGKVTECDVLKNYGFVHMATIEDALEAVHKLSGHNLYGKAMRVQHSTSDGRTQSYGEGGRGRGRGDGRGRGRGRGRGGGGRGFGRGGDYGGRGGGGRGGRGGGGERHGGSRERDDYMDSKYKDRDYYDYPPRRPPPPDPYYDRYYEDSYSRRPPPYPYSRDYSYPPSYRNRSRSPPPMRRPPTPPRYRRHAESPPPPPRGYYDYPPERYREPRSRYPPPPPRSRYSPPPPPGQASF